MVVRAISVSASCVRKASCAVMSTIGEREQTREFVVVQNLPRQILEEDAFFLLMHVKRHAAELAGFQRLRDA